MSRKEGGHGVRWRNLYCWDKNCRVLISTLRALQKPLSYLIEALPQLHYLCRGENLERFSLLQKTECAEILKKLFGYDYNAPEMYPVRELFMGASKLFVYRLGTEGAKATNTLADAKYVGTAGNKIITTVTKTTDGENPTGWAVRTYFDGELLSTNSRQEHLIIPMYFLDNDFVIWKSGVTLAETTKPQV